jgi:two-component system, chemotaxis family, sensor kinase CheA
MLENIPQQGCHFTISLPLTLAIMDGMIIRCADEYYVIPISQIIESVRLEAGDMQQIADGAQVMQRRGSFIRILDLKNILIIDTIKDSEDSSSLVVLVEIGNGEVVALCVDELIGQQQIVIKSLEEHIGAIKGFSGATILGNGQVALILDVAALSALSAASAKRSILKQEQAKAREAA